MKHKIFGNNLQVVALQLAPNELVYAEAGSMVYMTGNMTMTTESRGGFRKGIKRKLTGESYYVTQFRPAGGTGVVAFGGNYPGTIKLLELDGNKQYIVQKDGFLCAEDSVDLDMSRQRGLGKGMFGGHGFLLQKLSGVGKVFIHGAGDFIEKDLRPGEILKVSTSHSLAWENTVGFDIERSGNLKSMFFSGEGMFVTTLTGPGKVWLQSMTLPQLAASLRSYSSGSGSSGGNRSKGISIGGISMG